MSNGSKTEKVKDSQRFWKEKRGGHRMTRCFRCSKKIEGDEKMVALNLIDQRHAPCCMNCFQKVMVPDMTMTGKEFEESYGKRRNGKNIQNSML